MGDHDEPEQPDDSALHLSAGQRPEQMGPNVAVIWVLERKGTKVKARIMRQAEFPNGIDATAWAENEKSMLRGKGWLGLGANYYRAGKLPAQPILEREIVKRFAPRK